MKEDPQVQKIFDKFNEEFLAYQQMGGGISPSIALSAQDLSRIQTFSESLYKKQEAKEKSNAYLKESIDMSAETLCDELWTVMDKIYEKKPTKFVKAQSAPHFESFELSNSFKPATFHQKRAVQSWFCHYASSESDDVDTSYGESETYIPTSETKVEQFEHETFCSEESLMISENSLIFNIQEAALRVRDVNSNLSNSTC
ncbi:hypothetical protein BC833DRAFT_596054 [Globomyces pollinis-pini]|nr:hypothetical protein BC833DRAFT_596054 [Globomyces pollinis-pini]